mmetsp:Transcript_43964/g.133941  ORF Transcript_43964/g.133941 Transcript_43964/m.133941 type:complete len:87 (+) Transcript_43964:2466-2726(+)
MDAETGAQTSRFYGNQMTQQIRQNAPGGLSPAPSALSVLKQSSDECLNHTKQQEFDHVRSCIYLQRIVPVRWPWLQPAVFSVYPYM